MATITIPRISWRLSSSAPPNASFGLVRRAKRETAMQIGFKQESDVFRRQGIKRLVARVAPDKCATGTEAMENGRSAQWLLALDFVAQIENLVCACHAVERIPSGGRHRGAEIVPIRFVFSNKVTRHDKLVLAFHALVLSKVLCREITHGRIIYGHDHIILNVKVLALKNEVEKLIDKIGGLISSLSPPDLVLNRHCAECEFQTRCRQKAIDKDDLSLLGSM